MRPVTTNIVVVGSVCLEIPLESWKRVIESLLYNRTG